MPRACVRTPSASGKWAERARGGGKGRPVRSPWQGPGTAALGKERTSFLTHEVLVRGLLANILLYHPHLTPCRGLDPCRSQPAATWNADLSKWERSLPKVFLKAAPSLPTFRGKLTKLQATEKILSGNTALPWAVARCQEPHSHGLLHVELALPGSPQSPPLPTVSPIQRSFPYTCPASLAYVPHLAPVGLDFLVVCP